MKNTFSFPKKKAATTLVAGLTLCLASGSTLAQSCRNLVWSDEFSGSQVDTNNWEFQTGDGCAEGICGWGNNELQYYQAENATVSNGTLKITAKKERVKANQYTSARMRTANMPNSGEWTNGYFEARIKLPAGDGLWPAFWMLPTDNEDGWPTTGEIDIMESTGASPNVALGTMHFGDPWPDNLMIGNFILNRAENWSDSFHTYAVKWTPQEMRWYVDDILYSVVTPDDMKDSTDWTFEDFQYHFLLNVAVGGTLGGTVDDSIFPVDMEVDYVRVYDVGRPAIDGPNLVAPGATATFSVTDENGSNSSYSWSIPSSATLVSGAGTSSIKVDFSGATPGALAGNVSVAIDNSCNSHQLDVPVFVQTDLSLETVLADFDGTSNMTFTFFDGTADISNGVLTYTRNPESKWDAIVAETAAIPDALPFEEGTKAFTVDFYNTDTSLVGKEISIQLEDGSVATADNFPDGRHSKYHGTIEHADGWATLRFVFEDRMDGGTSDTSVDTFVMLIDGGSFNGDTYVMDNFNIIGADGSSGGGGEEATSVIVTEVTTGTKNIGQGNKVGTATVTLEDDLGNPVSSASVTGDFSGTFTETHTETTGTDGVANFETTGSAKGGVTVNFCVSDISNTSLTLDTTNSVGLCQ